MRRLSRKTLFAGLSTLLLVIVLGAVYISVAQELGLRVQGDSTAVCATTGASVPATTQQGRLRFNFAGYDRNETVALTFTFPDGRVLGLQTALAQDGPLNVNNVSVPAVLHADVGGELSFIYVLSHTWPTGCYTATAHALSSNRVYSATFVVVADALPQQIGTAALTALNVGDGTPHGTRGALVQLAGTGLGAAEGVAITIVTPNGTQLSFPSQPLTSKSGAFTESFMFNETSLIGTYRFVARGLFSGYQTSANFELVVPFLPPPSAPGTDQPVVRAVVIADPQNASSHRVEIQGHLFDPSQGVTLRLTLPAQPSLTMFGPQHTLPAQRTNEQGKFATAFTLDQRFPGGTYLVAAASVNNGKAAFASFTIARTRLAPTNVTQPMATPVMTTTPLTLTATTTTAPSVPTSTPTAVFTPVMLTPLPCLSSTKAMPCDTEPSPIETPADALPPTVVLVPATSPTPVAST